MFYIKMEIEGQTRECSITVDWYFVFVLKTIIVMFKKMLLLLHYNTLNTLFKWCAHDDKTC